MAGKIQNNNKVNDYMEWNGTKKRYQLWQTIKWNPYID